MSVGINLRRAGVGMVGVAAIASTALWAPPALAQEGTRTITVEVPVVSQNLLGPTRLIGLEAPQTLSPGNVQVSGRLWSGNIGAVGIGGIGQALGSAAFGLIADFGMLDNLQAQVQAGVGGPGAGTASVMGKYNLFNEAMGGSPLSLGVMARLSGSLPPLNQLFSMNLTNANLGFSVGLPVSKSLTDRLMVMAVPGLSFVGGPAGMVTTGNLGLGVDFAITDQFRAMVDATLGVPSAGVVAAPVGTAFNAGLRYAFTPNLTTDLYLGIGGFQPITGLNLPINVPAAGLAATYTF